MPENSPVPAPVPADVVEIERVLTHITYLAGRARQHERLMALSGLTLDRAAVIILRYIAEAEAGLAAVHRIREASRRGVEVALADWSSGGRRQLATLFHRLYDDFVRRAEAPVDIRPPA